jgi:hypothetical protein
MSVLACELPTMYSFGFCVVCVDTNSEIDAVHVLKYVLLDMSNM